MCAGEKIYDPKSACREIQDPKVRAGKLKLDGTKDLLFGYAKWSLTLESYM